MYTDVVQLTLEKPATEPDEGISLATLGKKKRFLIETSFSFSKNQRMWNMF